MPAGALSERAPGMLFEEAEELGAGAGPAGIGVGTGRVTTGPAMSALVDSPELCNGRSGGAPVRGAGVRVPAGNLPAAGHRGRRDRATVRALRRHDLIDEAPGVAVGHGRIPVTVKDDQRPGARRGTGRA